MTAMPPPVGPKAPLGLSTSRVKWALLIVGAGLYLWTIASVGIWTLTWMFLLSLVIHEIPLKAGLWALGVAWTVPAAFAALMRPPPGPGGPFVHPSDGLIWLTLALAVTSPMFWGAALSNGAWTMKLASACIACLGALQIVDASTQGRTRVPGLVCLLLSICTYGAKGLSVPLEWIFFGAP